MEAPQGINLVLETENEVYFGRYRGNKDGVVCLRHAAVERIARGSQREQVIRRSAKYGFAPEREDLVLRETDVRRVRRLGEVPKE